MQPRAFGLQLAALLALGCGSSGRAGGASATPPDGAPDPSSPPPLTDAAPTTRPAGDAAPASGDDGAAASNADGSTGCGATCDASAPSGTGPADPALPGPFAIAELDDTATIPATGDQNAIHCAYPTSGPDAGPYPVVVFAHGFQLAPSQYYGYLRHLASFGYVALTAEFPTNLFGNDNPKEAKDLAGALDWAAAKGGVLAGKVDASRAGISGHSLGGKLALLTASIDPRFKATITLDPVDGGPNGCAAPQCVKVASIVGSLAIPTAFLGETTDATSSSQACAPAADNYATLFGAAASPSFAVTVTGANHMSFLDDISTCGLACGFCNAATADHAKVIGLAQAYLAAFYERHLRGKTSYDDYLTGATAQSRYVKTSLAAIQTK